jgi:SAM-dependent methyltransferase
MASYTYDSSFFDHTTKVSNVSARKVVSVVQRAMEVKSVLDVGCAQGAWLSVWRDAGVADIAGLDGDYVDRARMLIDTARFTAHDLAQPFSLGRRFDLAQSLEVAEHLPATRAAGFVGDLTSHADVVLFSAAPPGQGGENHIHEMPYEYWRDLFADRGYALYDCVRPFVRDDMQVAPWYRYNAFLYVSKHVEETLPAVMRLFKVETGARITDVSSPMYQYRKEVVRRLPYWATQALSKAKARMMTGIG